jgi:hypothetical protein
MHGLKGRDHMEYLVVDRMIKWSLKEYSAEVLIGFI